MTSTQSMTPSDLFVVLEQAFRRRSRGCRACDFSLPYHVPNSNTWSVDPSKSCSDFCRLVLADLVDEYRGAYSLTAPGGFRSH